MPDRVLSRAEVATLTGATLRQLDHWSRRGWLDAQRPGSGHTATCSSSQLIIIHWMARLVAAGLTPEAAARVARGERELAPGITLQIASPEVPV